MSFLRPHRRELSGRSPGVVGAPRPRRVQALCGRTCCGSNITNGASLSVCLAGPLKNGPINLLYSLINTKINSHYSIIKEQTFEERPLLLRAGEGS